MADTANYSWPLPNKDGIQRTEIARVAAALVAADAKVKATDLALAAQIAAFNSHSHTFASLTSRPTTLAGYGITNAYTKAEADAAMAAKAAEIVNGSPALLDTLSELSAAIGNDPNFAATVAAQIGQKLTASAYTAADVLAKIKTVDGPDSQLDADLLDGQHGSYYRDLGSATGTLDKARLPDDLGIKTIGRPADFWSAGSYVRAGYGWTGSQGGYDHVVVVNGYRDTANKWVSEGVNGSTAAAMVQMDSQTGAIRYRQASSYPTGSNSYPPVTWEVAANGSASLAGALTVGGSVTAVSAEIKATDNSHYGVIAVRRLDSTRGAYIGWGNGGTTVNVTGDNASILSFTGWSSITTSADVTYTSDGRRKWSLRPIRNALAGILALRGVTFRRRAMKGKKADKRRHMGLIAQDVQAVFPEAVYEDEEGFLTLSAGALLGPIVQAFAEMDARLRAAEEKIRELTRAARAQEE